jgi:hypothetical protein
MTDTFFKFFIAIIDKFSNFNNSNDGHFWGVANRKDKYDKEVHSIPNYDIERQKIFLQYMVI